MAKVEKKLFNPLNVQIFTFQTRLTNDLLTTIINFKQTPMDHLKSKDP